MTGSRTRKKNQSPRGSGWRLSTGKKNFLRFGIKPKEKREWLGQEKISGYSGLGWVFLELEVGWKEKIGEGADQFVVTAMNLFESLR